MSSCARIFLFLLIVGILLPPVSARAEPDDVEVNLETLEKLEGYEPPPMFEPEKNVVLKPPPAKKSASRPIEKQPEKIAKSTITKPPIPPRRPAVFHATQSFIEKAREDYYKEQGKTEIRSTTELPVKPTSLPPPSPPGVAAPKTPAVASPYKAINANDPLQAELMNPTVQEILASIDDSKPGAEELSPAAQPPADIIVSNQEVSLLSDNGNSLSLEYQPGASALPPAMRQTILNRVNKEKRAGTGLARLEIRAFATPVEQTLSSARRVSLARALIIRDYLAENGVDSAIMSVRPMGDASDRTPRDRVDMLFMEP